MSPTDWNSYDKIETSVGAYLTRWKTKNGPGDSKKALGSVMRGSEAEGILAALEWTWCDHYQKYIAEKPLNVAVPSAKRQRTDDGEDSEPSSGEASKPNEGSAKGTGPEGGKKKGPAIGCYERGADHYVNECPIRMSKPDWQHHRPPFFPKP